MDTIPINVKIEIIELSSRFLDHMTDPSKTIALHNKLQSDIAEIINRIQQITNSINCTSYTSDLAKVESKLDTNYVENVCWLAENVVDKMVNVESIYEILLQLQMIMAQQPTNLIINKDMQNDLIED